MILWDFQFKYRRIYTTVHRSSYITLGICICSVELFTVSHIFSNKMSMHFCFSFFRTDPMVVCSVKKTTVLKVLRLLIRILVCPAVLKWPRIRICPWASPPWPPHLPWEASTFLPVKTEELWRYFLLLSRFPPSLNSWRKERVHACVRVGVLAARWPLPFCRLWSGRGSAGKGRWSGTELLSTIQGSCWTGRSLTAAEIARDLFASTWAEVGRCGRAPRVLPSCTIIMNIHLDREKERWGNASIRWYWHPTICWYQDSFVSYIYVYIKIQFFRQDHI